MSTRDTSFNKTLYPVTDRREEVRLCRTGCCWKRHQQTSPLKQLKRFNTVRLVCRLLGDRGSVTVPRERVWRDDGQEEALWLAGPDSGQIRPHGQRLLRVRKHHI